MSSWSLQGPGCSRARKAGNQTEGRDEHTEAGQCNKGKKGWALVCCSGGTEVSQALAKGNSKGNQRGECDYDQGSGKLRAPQV